MSSSFGNTIRLSIFGESHGPAIGMVLDSPPPGVKIIEEEVLRQLARRAPGNDPTATARKESDTPEFLSGVLDGFTTGAPLAAIIRNSDTHSKDYGNLKVCPRPSHADYAASVRYNGFNDIRGGGHFSGRLTAPLVLGGTICRLMLAEKGITIGGHVLKIGSAEDTSFDFTELDPKLLSRLSGEYFSVINDEAKEKMNEVILNAKNNQDSIGGIVEIGVTGLPAGLGDPMFAGVENVLSQVLYGVPAVKAVAFGEGFGFGDLLGSNSNDEMYYDDGKVKTRTNHSGGITGGITNGMPLIIRVALKPTPSISKEQHTVNLETEENTILKIKGRHDPCIVPRALPALEAAVAVGLANIIRKA